MRHTKPIRILINTDIHPSLPYNRNITVYCGVCIIIVVCNVARNTENVVRL